MNRLIIHKRAILAILALLIGSFVFVMAVSVSTVHAQETNTDVTRDEVNQVASELYCPLCSGVRLDTCDLKACEQMREEIALRLQNGDDVESIKAYFFAQYGPQVLGEPPRDSFLNWLAWILPFVVLAIGGVLLVMRARRIVQFQSTSAVASVPSTAQPFARNGQNPPAAGQDDIYTQKLDEELRLYE